MSVEWYKFRLREGIDPADLADLVRDQSAGFRKAINLPQSHGTAESGQISEEERNEGFQQYLRCTKALFPFLSFVDAEPSGEKQDIERNPIAYIAFNDMFPHSWREEAKSTLLPSDLPALMHKWKAYAQDMRMGYYEDFLYRLFMYEDYNPHHNGYPSWANLLQSFHRKIQAAPGQTEDWAHTRAFKKTLEEITSDPVLPPTMEVPHFDPNSRDTDLQPETRTAFAEYKKESERLMHQILAWNRCVPEAEKLRIPTFIPVQVRMRQRMMASRDWLQPFFEWCEKIVADGCGLFLAV